MSTTSAVGMGPVGPGETLQTPTGLMTVTKSGQVGGVTAASAHNMLISVGLGLAFVVVATMVAGINDSLGSGILALMIALLVLRGLFNVSVFGEFASKTSVLPGRG